ncbi:hypothetical protein BJF85_05995 [Saccharomonospora sp. CUA-673]|uniref:DUF6194 family protein n=1 Tax=Saccharomonospora sp. CUA-673 TaxID=1904969 RepID=UPI00095BB8D7|nr:DUF6194 family protein [Saccharomonospora sp. CUA-673]OLT40671.1 hypothetical protein BJF85_05995 [Saccharomonospora sp. CUA-673]
MTPDDILELVRGLPGALVLSPEPGGPHPEAAWGDHFVYHAPGGEVPQRTQPHVTVVTKNGPGDERSNLDVDGRWRVNVRVPRDRFAELTGHDPRTVDFGGADSGGADSGGVDFAAVDTVLPHPLYARAGFVAVVNPGPRTTDLLTTLIHEAHARAAEKSP